MSQDKSIKLSKNTVLEMKYNDWYPTYYVNGEEMTISIDKLVCFLIGDEAKIYSKSIGRKRRTLTSDEQMRIEDWYSGNFSVNEIADQLSISNRVVSAYLRSVGKLRGVGRRKSS